MYIGLGLGSKEQSGVPPLPLHPPPLPFHPKFLQRHPPCLSKQATGRSCRCSLRPKFTAIFLLNLRQKQASMVIHHPGIKYFLELTSPKHSCVAVTGAQAACASHILTGDVECHLHCLTCVISHKHFNESQFPHNNATLVFCDSTVLFNLVRATPLGPGSSTFRAVACKASLRASLIGRTPTLL